MENSRNIEAELRSFITKEQYFDLISFFEEEGKKIKEDMQETYYFDTPQDLRIQKNEYYGKVWLKKGQLHDDHREELEIKFEKKDFRTMRDLFEALGFGVEIKWKRKRIVFEWRDVEVMLDYSEGYGYIIEMEKMSTHEEAGHAVTVLKMYFDELGIPVTPKEEFKERYNYYKEHWKEILCKPETK